MSHIHDIGLTLRIGRKEMTWTACIERPDLDAILRSLVEQLGEPSYAIRMGEVGEPRREIVVEPIEAPRPVEAPEPVPA